MNPPVVLGLRVWLSTLLEINILSATRPQWSVSWYPVGGSLWPWLNSCPGLRVPILGVSIPGVLSGLHSTSPPGAQLCVPVASALGWFLTWQLQEVHLVLLPHLSSSCLWRQACTAAPNPSALSSQRLEPPLMPMDDTLSHKYYTLHICFEMDWEAHTIHTLVEITNALGFAGQSDQMRLVDWGLLWKPGHMLV